MKQIIEYGDVQDGGMATSTILAEGMGAFGMSRTLVHSTAGYECAGSMARLTGEKWGCLFVSRDGNRGGNWYTNEAQAREHFLRMTTPIVEQVS